jgi:hypothetical protein
MLSKRAFSRSKGQALAMYLNSLSNLGRPATWHEIRAAAGRIGNSSRIYKDELLEKGFIDKAGFAREKGVKKPSVLFRVSKEGARYLKGNKIYWN